MVTNGSKWVKKLSKLQRVGGLEFRPVSNFFTDIIFIRIKALRARFIIHEGNSPKNVEFRAFVVEEFYTSDV